jgi:hypothetical protein
MQKSIQGDRFMDSVNEGIVTESDRELEKKIFEDGMKDVDCLMEAGRYVEADTMLTRLASEHHELADENRVAIKAKSALIQEGFAEMCAGCE